MQSDKSLKVYFMSNACEEGRLNTARLKIYSKQAGFNCTNKLEQADLVMFYPCGHLNHNDSEAADIIKKINEHKKPSARLIVWGCLPKINPESIKEIYNGPMVGPEEWDFFSELFNQPREQINQVYANTPCSRGKTLSLQGKLNIFKFEKLYCHIGRTWYIKIVSGCTKCCTYSSDRLVYKQAISVPIDSILKQFEQGLATNCKHFYFVGRDLGSYGYDVDSTLADLLNKIAEAYPNQTYKISLFNVSPDSLVALYPKISQTVLSKRIFQIGSHIQSGSKDVLKQMGKTFEFDDWKKVLLEIGKKYPNIRVATSIMVGFPGETEEDFTKTAHLLRNIPFDRIDLYAYDERPNLPSLKQKGRVSQQTIIARWTKANRLLKVNILKRRIKKIRILY